MSLKDDLKYGEQKFLNKLNREESWVEKHPGWVTAIGLVLFVALIVAVVKGCH